MEAILLAAGKGTRMRSEQVKVLHPALGFPVLGHVLETLARLGVKAPRVVVGTQAAEVRSFLKQADRLLKLKSQAVLQKEQKGTGHAVQIAARTLRKARGEVLVWPGDMPLVRAETLAAFIREHRLSDAKVSVLSCVMAQPEGYGRVLRAGGNFIGIREELDASESEKRIQEVNTGIYLFEATALFEALGKIKPNNQKGEYYLTDTIEILSVAGAAVAAFPLARESEGLGINSRTDLAEVVRVMKDREIRKHMENGVTFESPEQTFVAPDVKIGGDTVIYPWSYIERGVRIGRHCQIGPFAKIRAGSVIEDGAVVGSFVEINRSHLGRGVLAKHLAYLGDAVVGAGTNIGAGTVTANYDGKNKHRTQIGPKSFIGSNTVLIAPVTLGQGAKTGAGSVVTAGTKVPSGQVVVGVPARPLKKVSERKRK